MKTLVNVCESNFRCGCCTAVGEGMAYDGIAADMQQI